MQNKYPAIWVLLFVILMSGCASVKEVARGIGGLSTKVLEEGRKEGAAKTFNQDYHTCYTRIKHILKIHSSYIYAQSQDKHMLAIYVSAEDTTPVGIFFVEIDANNTRIEISSPAVYAKELIAARIFSALEGPFEAQEEEGK